MRRITPYGSSDFDVIPDDERTALARIAKDLERISAPPATRSPGEADA